MSCVVSERVLLRCSISAKSGNKGEDMDGIGDEILKRLQQENGEFCQGKPAWQLILGFLSSKKCMALVIVSNGMPSCLLLSTILEPLSVHVGMLYILDSTAELRITRTLSPTETTTGNFSQENLDHFDVVQVSQGINGLTIAPQQDRIDVVSDKCKEQSALCKRKRKREIAFGVSSKRLKSSEVSADTPSQYDLQLLKYNTWEPLYTAIVRSICKADPSKSYSSPNYKIGKQI